MQNRFLYLTIGIFIGLVVGFFAANSLNRESAVANTGSPSETGQVPSALTAQTVDELLQKANAEPQNFAAQMQTGDLYAQIGRFDQAIEFYKRGLLLQPESFQANVVVANALFDSRRFEEAEGYYVKALTINDKDVNARIDLGATFVERASPDYERAIKEFDSALETDPKSEAAIYYLGIAHLRKGSRENALKMLTELEKVNAASGLIGKLRQNIDPPQ